MQRSFISVFLILMSLSSNYGFASQANPTLPNRQNILGKPQIWLGEHDHATLPNAISAIGRSNATLNVPAGIHAITSDLTIPANITLVLGRGAIVTVSENKTLTIMGGIDAGLYQIFSTGGVVFGPGSIEKVPVQWFGAVNDGAADCSAAFAQALSSATVTGIPVYFPQGAYYIPTFASVTSGKVYLLGDGPGLSVLRSKLDTPASCEASVSYKMLNISHASQVTIKDLTLDGMKSASQSNNRKAHYREQMGLVEIRNSSQISFERVETTRFAGSMPSASPPYHGTENPDRSESVNCGPIFIRNCIGVEVSGCKLTSPSFSEGWTIVDCQDVEVGGFRSNAGTDSGPWGTSSPLQVIGPLTANVKIHHCAIYRSTGSAIVCVGKKNFILSNNIIDGGYTDAPDCYNAGINIAAPVMDIWPAGTSTLMENIVIEGNIFKNLGFFAVFTGGTTTTRHKGLVFKGNTVDTAPGALQVYRAENVTINGNVCRRIAKFGTPNISGNCFDINWVNLGIISDNIIDGNEILTIGGAERKLYGGIMAYSCKKLTIANNVLYGAGYSFIHCPAEDDSGYGDLSIINNQGWDARGTVTVAPFVLGTDKAHRLQSVKFAGNTYNGKLASGQNTGKFSKHFADWPDCVQVKLSEGQSIKPGKVTVVAFDAKNYDLNEVFNTATHRFQPSQRGVYQIASQVVLLNVDAATYAILYIYKNNSLEATLRQEYCPKSQHSYLAGSAFVFLNGSSDYLDIRLVHESASVKILSNNADASRFEARFLAPQ